MSSTIRKSLLSAWRRFSRGVFSGTWCMIVTPWPGIEAARVEQLITRNIERQVGLNARVEEIKSISRNGLSVVYAEVQEKSREARPRHHPAQPRAAIRPRICLAERGSNVSAISDQKPDSRIAPSATI
jgi:hypothetical protein